MGVRPLKPHISRYDRGHDVWLNVVSRRRLASAVNRVGSSVETVVEATKQPQTASDKTV
jgi:hypothetical protein